MWSGRNSTTATLSGLRLAGSTLARRSGRYRGNKVTIFFRRKLPPFEPAVHWVFADDIDATYRELASLGANIVDPLERKPWGLRQFTVEDLDGNRFYFHHD
jgi:uncharacterized glyoxalase superfamily protein PhnB